VSSADAIVIFIVLTFVGVLLAFRWRGSWTLTVRPLWISRVGVLMNSI
jgi:hypothetical protein